MTVNDTRTGDKEMTVLRITAGEKDIIAYQVAREWVESGKRFLKAGEKPAKLSRVAPTHVWVKIVNRYGEEAAETISQRTLDGIVKIAKHHAKMIVHGVRK